MSAADGTWTLGVKVGLPIAILGGLVLLALVVAVAVGAIRANDRGLYDSWSMRKMCRVWLFIPVVLFIGYAVLVGFAFWPWQAAYHQYRPVSGTVATIANRLVSAGDQGGSNQKFVVVLTSGPQQYGVEDTRAALLRPGDHVSLQCIRVYDYGSTNAGYDCKWGQS